MPQTARRLPEPPIARPNAPETAGGERHGEVGAMHRAIEQRLVGAADQLAVVPLATRPGDALAAGVSRLAGWAALGGGFAATLAVLLLR